MSVKLSGEQNKLIRKIIEDDEGIRNYEIDTNAGTIKGDNYMGIIITVTVKDKDSGKVLNLILKASHKSPEFRKQAPVLAVFTREIFIYSKLFPELKKFQLKYGKEVFSHYPKLYGYCDLEFDEALVFDNLKSKGFKLWERTKTINSEHISLVLRTYAKLHGVSLAMKNLESHQFKQLTVDLKDIFESFDFQSFNMKSIFEKGYKAVCDENAKHALEQFESNALEYFTKLKSQTDQYFVVSHGDCWCNNMLFSYKDKSNTDKPTDMRLLDFQMTKYAHILSDIVYFFYVSASKDILYEYEKYLKIYYDSLSSTMKTFGLDSNEIFSFDALLNEWKLYSKFGIFTALMVFNIMFVESSEVQDLEKIAIEGKIDIFEEFSREIKNSDLYSQRVNDLVMFQYEKGFL